MTVIGLCGGSGSGKTTASSVMASLGAAVIDTDRVYREICIPGSPCVRELASSFGDDILLPDGSLDRTKLGAIVFSDDGARAELNRITHRYIAEETKRLLASYEAEGKASAVIDAPLLFESGFNAFCDITVGVTADEETRIARITARDGISRERAAARIASQLSDIELRRRCDRIIENNDGQTRFISDVRSFYMSAVFGGGTVGGGGIVE